MSERLTDIARLVTWLRRHANKARQLDMAGEERGALTAIDWIENWLQKEGATISGDAFAVNAESTARDADCSTNGDCVAADLSAEDVEALRWLVRHVNATTIEGLRPRLDKRRALSVLDRIINGGGR